MMRGSENGLKAVQNFLVLLQLTNSSVPLGAYNYSDGLEFLIESEAVDSAEALTDWLKNELQFGSIRMDITVMLKVCEAIAAENLSELHYWNSWLNGTRETKELRQQSLQMGQSLLKLLGDLDAGMRESIGIYQQTIGKQCHYAVAFGLAIALWDIDRTQAVGAYLHGWLSNLVSAGVKSIPFGQTQGQKIIYELHSAIAKMTEELLQPKDEHLYACSWGLSLASMNHETQYTRLFRS